jgi:redox-sensitive bicupin YhaK (pirin superfamily)
MTTTRRTWMLGLGAVIAAACARRAAPLVEVPMLREVTLVARAQENRAVPFLVTRLSEATLGRGALDPFLAGDEFVMRDPTFPPHPHAGFSAVTWMFEDGEGAFRNRDTFSGADARIEPGAIHWTAAGRGMIHEEVPEMPGRASHGIQLFVDLPAALKHGDPAALHLASSAVRSVLHEGARVRVVVGAHHGVTSSIVPPTAVTLLDARLERGGAFDHDVAPEENVLVWVRRGSAKVNGTRVDARSVARLAPTRAPARALRIDGVDEVTELVVMHGRPLGQPVIFHGPFVGTSSEEVRGYVEAYQRGRMGHLAPSFGG